MYITCLEKQNMNLSEYIYVVKTIENKLQSQQREKEKQITKNWKTYDRKIKDLKLFNKFPIF